MTKLSLDQHPSEFSHTNPGLATASNSSSWKQTDKTDPVWKASKILEQLDRFDTSTAKGVVSAPTGTAAHQKIIPATNKAVAFGEIPSVPWLDNMAREYCEKTLREAEEKAEQNSGLYDETNEAPAYLVVEMPTLRPMTIMYF